MMLHGAPNSADHLVKTVAPQGDPFLATAHASPDFAALGWSETELFFAGQASSLVADRVTDDGTWQAHPGEGAPFRTRAVLRRPESVPFSGTLLVEWLNVSSGFDACPDWTYLAEEIIRQGHAWLGVSAQSVGVEGGAGIPGAPELLPGMGPTGLKAVDERYAELHHPGDAYSYDIFGLIAQRVRDELGATRVVAIGESQSASALTTYINGVHPLAGLFDAFLVHSRAATGLPIDLAGTGIDTSVSGLPGIPTRLRTDLDAPVLVVQTEGDLFPPLNYLAVRQADSARVRTWEIAGSAHADAFMIGDTAALFGTAEPVNTGQQVFVLRAALRHLLTWLDGGAPPPTGPLLEIDGDDYARDAHGLSRGGVRTPAVDAPVERLSGRPEPGSPLISALFGSARPLTGVWPDRETYLAAYEKAADAGIAAGFLLADDRAAILADARPHLVS